ncbi:alpha/beta hydrolase [Salinactinospora qingdaonensis]|uniref:Pimeloyl-ACP methyl ester carboxylesterase n=1 Tax=Salinactinospora qingdaonensis TaxID=702744 RepID=A0ABP7F7G3_9ACTN
MRARQPDTTGFVDRDGVRIGYEVHGDGDVTVLLLPAWAIVHSRLWKAQIPYLAKRYRVITYDPRGNGASDRPVDPAAYDVHTQAEDALAVLDAAGAQRAVLVGNSFGSILAYLLAALHPERVAGAVLIGTTLNVTGRDDYPLAQALLTFDEDKGSDEGWNRYNRHSFQRDFAGFVRFFAGEAMNDPHSTKHWEDAVSWGLETTPEALAATLSDRAGVPPAKSAERLRALAPRITCPVLVVHGTQDRIGPVFLGRSVASLLRAPIVELEGAGHCPQARYPVQVNRLLRRFVDETVQAGTAADSEPRRTGPSRGPRREASRPRVLYLSSPIGLGHARRDLAIATELRSLVPDARIDWLAQDPVTRVLATAGERVHPASRALASESAHLQAESCEHDLHVFEAVRRMDEILVANFMTFLDVIQQEHYDLVVGDESWDVDHFLHEDPAVKRARFAWLTDFVGYVPMPAGGERERLLTADYNAEMLGHIEQHPDIRDVSIFVGDPDDVVDLPFGPGLPGIREWTQAHYSFAGYITGFDPASLGDRSHLRRELGYHPDETVVIAAVGGSGVGGSLLRRVIEAHPLAAENVPGLRTIVVTGPRLDPASLPDAPGVEKRAYVPDLHRHLAACDLALVQGGLTTTMELTATGRPFLYFPLRNHFEQQIHVPHRLRRYGAGRAMDYATATPEAIAHAMTEELGRTLTYQPVDGGGARRAATLLAECL